MLCGVVNVLGSKKTRDFVKDYHWLCRKPLPLCILGIFFMLMSQMPMIHATYSLWVYWYTFAIGILVLAIGVYLYCKLMSAMLGLLEENKPKDKKGDLHEDAGQSKK